MTKQINWNSTDKEHRIIEKIAKRAATTARAAGFDYSVQDAQMDVTAAHLNGCRLDLQRLLDADDFNFNHDVFGICRNLNRTTGELEGCFLPRHASRE